MSQLLSVSLAPGAPEYNSPLTAHGYSCVINNPSAGWWYLPDALQYILPYSYGSVILFPNGVQNAHILFQAPAGVQNLVPTQNINYATFVFYDVALPPAAGVTGTSAFSRRAVTIDVKNIVTLPGGIYTYELVAPASEGLYINMRAINVAVDTGVLLIISRLLPGDTVAQILYNGRASLSDNPLDSLPQWIYDEPFPTGTQIIISVSGFPTNGITLIFRY